MIIVYVKRRRVFPVVFFICSWWLRIVWFQTLFFSEPYRSVARAWAWSYAATGIVRFGIKFGVQ